MISTLYNLFYSGYGIYIYMILCFTVGGYPFDGTGVRVINK